MIDYVASRIARAELEARISRILPVYDHDERFNDDRKMSLFKIEGGLVPDASEQPNWPVRQLGRLFSNAGHSLSELGERLSQGQPRSLEPSLKDR